MDLEIKRDRKKSTVDGQHKSKWEALTKEKAHELREMLVAIGTRGTAGTRVVCEHTTANYIRKYAREVLGVTNGYWGGHKGD